MADASDLDRLINERLDALLPQEARRTAREADARRMTIIATKGTLDWAYPPFILSSTAAALGWNVSIFFTFYGLQPAEEGHQRPQDQPARQSGHADENAVRPGLVQEHQLEHPQRRSGASCPGFETLATTLMKQTIKNKGVAGVEELRTVCLEGGVNLIGCQMTVDLFGFTHDDFIPEVKEYCGAATFLPMARDADVSLFI